MILQEFLQLPILDYSPYLLLEVNGYQSTHTLAKMTYA
jgi:hypothetical protein